MKGGKAFYLQRKSDERYRMGGRRARSGIMTNEGVSGKRPAAHVFRSLPNAPRDVRRPWADRRPMICFQPSAPIRYDGVGPAAHTLAGPLRLPTSPTPTRSRPSSCRARRRSIRHPAADRDVAARTMPTAVLTGLVIFCSGWDDIRDLDYRVKLIGQSWRSPLPSAAASLAHYPFAGSTRYRSDAYPATALIVPASPMRST
jgi:hypothetical protein